MAKHTSSSRATEHTRTNGAGRGRRASGGRRRPPPDLDVLVDRAASAPAGSQREYLAGRLAAFGAAAAQACDRRIVDGVRRAWSLGYAPEELLHVVGRLLTRGHAALAAGAVLREQPPHPPPGWEHQLHRISDDHPGERVDVGSVGMAVDVVAALRQLPAVPSVGGHTGHERLDDAVLAKVRALLAKAESTEFDAEAELLTAKAQDLITRHAIDAVRLRGASADDQPGRRRILLHDPYLSSKALLVAVVAEANRCESAFSADLGWSTVIGFDADLEATEVLVASLLAQCLGAMARLGPQRDAAGRSRTRSFRTAFIRGFAVRIGERLAEVNRHAVGAIDHAGDVLPVLASRADQVGDAFTSAFPQIERRTVGQGTNGHGWIAGATAADMATLHRGRGRLGG